MKTFNWISRLFQDERGEPSSKRFVGILSAMMLLVVFGLNIFMKDLNTPAESMVDAVTLLAVGGLGFSTVDKFWSSKNNLKNFKDKTDDEVIR